MPHFITLRDAADAIDALGGVRTHYNGCHGHNRIRVFHDHSRSQDNQDWFAAVTIGDTGAFTITTETSVEEFERTDEGLEDLLTSIATH